MPSYTSSSRFRLDVTDFDNNYVCTLPYKDLQGEWKLGMDGENIRFTVPYKTNSWLTPDKLEPGKHMIFLYDKLMPAANPIRFGGPLWDATASSKEGTLNCSASSILTLYKKRLLKADKVYIGRPESAIADLLMYTDAIKHIFGVGVAGGIVVWGAINLDSLDYAVEDQAYIFDLVKDICDMGSGVDLFTQWTGKATTASAAIQLYGGRIKPVAPTIFLEYGGKPSKGALPQLNGYALTKSAQTISNASNVISSTGDVALANDYTAQADYKQLYETCERGITGLADQVDVNARAALNLKKAPRAVTIPQLTLKGLDPFIDFTYGDQAQVTIDDGWATYDGPVRIIGWQSSIGRHDQMTNVIYTNDLTEIT